ncbi:hypothetical protein [Rosistilla oblonga]|uniref:hypothetical protein n=1 Tax=Rosistilla oblonga TaxID=2527990 RepID=UPI003A9762E6
MTQKYAVVPIWTDTDDIDVYRFGRGEAKTFEAANCKLTREQVEAMALVAANKFYGFNYTAVDEKFLKSFVAGLVSGGLSVED